MQRARYIRSTTRHQHPECRIANTRDQLMTERGRVNSMILFLEQIIQVTARSYHSLGSLSHPSRNRNILNSVKVEYLRVNNSLVGTNVQP